MSNDSRFLRCVNCGSTHWLFKYYPNVDDDRYPVSYSVGDFHPEEFEEWIVKHIQCSPRAGRFDLGDDKCFEVVINWDDPYTPPR